MKKITKKGGPVIIVGDSPIAEVAYEYLTNDSPYEVIAFTVDKKFLKEKTLMGHPVVPFEEVQIEYKPEIYKMFVAVGYPNLNRLRTRFCLDAKKKGYHLITYISSHAFVWHNVKVGENCFILEDNTIQPFVKIGDNVTLWSGNHIGHHSTIENNCFVSSQVVVSGFCHIGENSFLGVNSALSHRTTIAKDNIIAMGAVVVHNTEPEGIYVGNPARRLKKSSLDQSSLYRKG